MGSGGEEGGGAQLCMFTDLNYKKSIQPIEIYIKVHTSVAQSALTRIKKKKRKILKSTYWTLSWGLALRLPLTEEEGSRRLCSQMELAPLPYNVWTI